MPECNSHIFVPDGNSICSCFDTLTGVIGHVSLNSTVVYFTKTRVRHDKMYHVGECSCLFKNGVAYF